MGGQGEAAVDQLRRWLGEKIGEIPAPQRASERAAEAVTVDYGTVNGAAQHWRCRRPPMFTPYVTSPTLAAAKLTRLYPFTREKREEGATDTESHICRSELAWAERKRVAFFALLVIRRSRNQIKSRLSGGRNLRKLNYCSSLVCRAPPRPQTNLCHKLPKPQICRNVSSLSAYVCVGLNVGGVEIRVEGGRLDQLRYQHHKRGGSDLASYLRFVCGLP